MDADFRKALFEDARTRFERARRWGWFAVAALLAFQLFTLAPYLSTRHALEATRHAQTRQAAMRERVAAITERVSALRTRALEQLRADLEELLRQKRGQLQALSTTVQRIRDGAAQPSTNLALQAAVDPQSGTLPGAMQFDIDAQTRRRIERATDNLGLREVLEPVVEQQIVGPGFRRLSGRWRRSLAQLEADADAIRADLGGASDAFPEPAADTWVRIESSLAGILEAAGRVRFAPPADRFWWTTEANKRVVLFALGDDAERSLGQADGLRQLEAELEKAAREQSVVLSELKTRLDELETVFEAQKQQLARYVGGGAALPVELATVAALFPWVVAALLVGWWLHLAGCTRRLARVAVVVPDRDAMRASLHGTFGGPVSALAGTVLSGGLGMAWLAVTSEHIAHYLPVQTWHDIGALPAGAAAAGLATLARLLTVGLAARATGFGASAQ